MSFAKLYKRTTMPTLTSSERKRITILIADSNPVDRQSLRQTLTELGYGTIFDAPDHVQALKKIQERGVSHVIFEAKKTNMPARDFLTKAMELDERLIAIPSSWEPTADDVFGLLIIGARGYVVKPYTQENLDEAIVMATKGEPISESILYAKDRNEALSSLVISSLGKLSVTMRQSYRFETARRELPRKILHFRRAVDLARTFAEGGADGLLGVMVESLVERSAGPATRLGRLRKRLESKKAKIVSPDDTKLQPKVVPKSI